MSDEMNPDSTVDLLRAIVGSEGLLLNDDALPYEQGARYGAGKALCVVRPASTDQVSQVVALCAAKGVKLIAQGANTGLVGASSPDTSGGQIILSLSRLRHRCEVDVIDRTVEVDAGVLLHELNQTLEPHGLHFPIDLSADPSIGGMISSNTGGARLLRYGDVRHNLLSVEAVLFDPPGEIARFGKPLRKNNTGFDLMQLFVGTSGAVGVITAATLQVAALPRQAATALLVPSTDGAVNTLLKAFESNLGDFLSAFEGMSGAAIQAALNHVPSLRSPFGKGPLPDFSILVELTSSAPVSSALDLESLLMSFLEERIGHEVVDAVIGKGHEIWQLRHSLSDGARALGKVIGFDVSVRRADLLRFRSAARDLVERQFPGLKVVDFGHVGDGGLHFNLVWPRDSSVLYDEAVVADVRDQLYELVVIDFDGSFSAEHGVGPHNLHYYHRFTAPSALRISGEIQRLLDPERISGSVQFGPAEVAASSNKVKEATL